MALRVYFYIAEAISRKKFETFEEWLRNTLTRLIFARLIFARINFCGFCGIFAYPRKFVPTKFSKLF